MALVAAQPVPLAFDAATTALIVIDMQRDFVEPGGFGAAPGNDVSLPRAIIPATARLIAGFRAAGLPVFRAQGAIGGWTASVDQIVLALHV
jgi:isochorismate hydrolase